MEQWKIIETYPNYKISNLGNVKNKQNKILKQRTTKNRYKEIGLRNGNKKQKFFLVHRLVAFNFIPTKEGKYYVNHIDGKKNNNLVENLEWVTQSENQKHAYETGLQKVTQDQINRLKYYAEIKKKPIKVINKKLEINAVYSSIKEASENVPCNEKTLRNLLKNKHKSRLGYEVSYLEKGVVSLD